MSADISRMIFALANDDGCDSIIVVTAFESLPTDLAAAHAMIIAELAARLEAEAVAASAKAEAANAKAAEALISYLTLEMEELRHQLFGSRSEHKAIARTDGTATRRAGSGGDRR